MIKNNNIKNIILLIILLLSKPAFASTNNIIIFDIGGVLVDTSKTKAFSILGFKNFALYAAQSNPLRFYNLKDNLQEKLFKSLELAKPFNPGKNYLVKDDKNKILPPIMLDWLAGESKENLLKQVEPILQNKYLFENSAQASLIQNAVNMIFDPELFISTRVLLKDNIKLLQELKSRNNTIILCSNWDNNSFNLLQKKFPEIFDYVDGYFISGQEKLLKPDPEIFNQLKIKFNINLNKQITIFIDDQQENRTAASQAGFLAVHPDQARELINFLKI